MVTQQTHLLTQRPWLVWVCLPSWCNSHWKDSMAEKLGTNTIFRPSGAKDIDVQELERQKR